LKDEAVPSRAALGQRGAQARGPTRSAADVAMDRYAAGDDAAFAVVYDALAPRIFAYLCRGVRSRAHAEDLLQQTFLCLHRSRGTFVAHSAVVPWAFAIAQRLLIDELRRRKRSVLSAAQELSEGEPLPARGPGADDLLQADDLGQALQKKLAELPALQRAAFELVRFDGLSYAEAAEALGLTINSVKLRAHRALLALRSALPR
jgi:RNA polymerase sigma-70 factor (ECF subfamily)